MEKRLKKLYEECIYELNSIGIKITNLGTININLAKRKSKRYGVCKQENPVKETKYIEKIGRKKFIRYGSYKNHNIEISKWLMELDDDIIKNTIMHEIIHCFPNCNNHGKEFKIYSKIINEKLGYNISRLGNVAEDYRKSNLEYKNDESYKYKIECEICGQTFYRKRMKKNFLRKYRCGKCNGNFKITNI